MSEAGLMGVALLEQHNQLWQHFRQNHRLSVESQATRSRLQASRFPIYAVILDAALPAGTFLDPSEPDGVNATICRWTGTRYVQTTERLKVWNHGHNDLEADTPGAAIPIDGHYWMFADCEPLEERDPPPWESSE